MIWTWLNVITRDTGEPLEVNLIIPIWLNSRVGSLDGSTWKSSEALLSVVFKPEWESMTLLVVYPGQTFLSVLSFIRAESPVGC